VKAPRPPGLAGEPALRRAGAEIALAEVRVLALHEPGPESAHALLATEHRDKPELFAVLGERIDCGREASGKMVCSCMQSLFWEWKKRPPGW
jgi:hypothetical protein